MRQTLPNEFQRRPLADYKHWKCVKFRTFLLYLSSCTPVALKNRVKEHVYDYFLTLHVAITILCNKHLKETQIKYADQLLCHFVKSFKYIYGVENISHNVHCLLHLANDARLLGPLDNFSALKYENYMQLYAFEINPHEKSSDSTNNKTMI